MLQWIGTVWEVTTKRPISFNLTVIVHVCLSVLVTNMCIIEDFYQCLCVPANCYISTVLSLPWYYPSGHYHYVPSSGLTAAHIICSVKEQRG